MFRKKRRRSPTKRSKPLLKRLFGSFMAVVVLTAFVLGLAFSVKKISTLGTEEAVHLTGPILRKIGVSEEAAGEVAGDFVERIVNTNIAPAKTYEEDKKQIYAGSPATLEEKSGGASTARDVLFQVALLADSENDTEHLMQALDKVNSLGIDTVFFLGDYTSFGGVENLEKAKAIMDESGFTYYSLPGDHDLAASMGPSNYYQVFGVPEALVNIQGVIFVLVDNSANFTPIDADKIGQYKNLISGADFVLMSQPLFYPLETIAKPVMGLVKGETVSEVKDQAKELLDAIRLSNTRAVIAGDHHSFSMSEDELDSNLKHFVVGSVTDERADRGRTSISVLSYYTDETYSIEEVQF